MMLLSLLFACGEKCPEGYEVNDEEKACYPVEETTDTDTTDTNTTDTNTTDSGDTEDDTGAVVVDPFTDFEKLNGKIIIPSLFEGRLIPRSAFWYQVGDKALVYMTANQSATCDLVANRLNPNTQQLDPSDLYILDHCNMGIVVEDVNDLSTASYFSECTFGMGSFSQSGAIWQWSGTDNDGVEAEYFIGAGLTGETLDWQQDGERVAVEVSVTDWAGNFPYSNNYNTSGAVGTGTGYIIATECAALENTTYLTPTSNED